MERTLVLLKPDAVARRIVGEIISRFERKGFKIVALKLLRVDRELAEKHYAIHSGKPFFNDLVRFITSLPVVALVLEGNNAVGEVRRMVGATSPQEAEIGTIRGDLALAITSNLIHASDSHATAEQEIKNFFRDEEILSYQLETDCYFQ